MRKFYNFFLPNLHFQDVTNLFDLCVSKSKIPHSVIGKYMDTLLSNQKVPIFFTTFRRPVLVTLSLIEIEGETEKKRKMLNDQDSNIEIY